jgi:hypothetical protein
MNQDRTVIHAANYAEAVALAHEAFRRTGRPTTLCAGEYGNYWSHRIDAAGIAVDRNFNSGVPERQQLTEGR